MNHRKDFRPVVFESIDDAVGPQNHFSAGVTVDLRDHTSRARELLQAIDGFHDALDHERRVVGRIPCDVCSDGLDVFDRLEGPDDAGHLSRRLRAASCDSVSPASACATPRSTFARK